MIEYNNTLRQGIFDAYSGIIQGLGPQACARYLGAEVPVLLDFVSSIGTNMDSVVPEEEVIKGAINLLGDLCSCMPVRLVGSQTAHAFKTGVLVHSVGSLKLCMPSNQHAHLFGRVS
jgi:hypothetical protein